MIFHKELTAEEVSVLRNNCIIPGRLHVRPSLYNSMIEGAVETAVLDQCTGSVVQESPYPIARSGMVTKKEPATNKQPVDQSEAYSEHYSPNPVQLVEESEPEFMRSVGGSRQQPAY